MLGNSTTNSKIFSYPLSVYNCGLISSKQNYNWGPGISFHHLLCIVAQGSGELTKNNVVLQLHQNDVFYLPPNTKIEYVSAKETSLELYWVGFDGSHANELIKTLPFTDENFACTFEEANEAIKLMRTICNNQGTKPYQFSNQLGCLYLLCGLLNKHGCVNIIHEKNSPNVIKKAKKYIHYNFALTIGVDDIAKAIGVSRSYLYRVFVNETGCPPIDYLTNYRIKQACVLLKENALSIAEIANSVGFDDQFYFSRVFKKIEGVPPSKYTEQA